MENAGIFYDHLEYFTVVWHILWPFVNVIWYIFPRFGILCQEKCGNPDYSSFPLSPYQPVQSGRFNPYLVPPTPSSAERLAVVSKLEADASKIVTNFFFGAF
jgi:hypothetical protein